MIIAWACAHGAIWDVVQVVAWARMFAGNAQTMPVASALAATLDGSRPCELCSGVAAAKDVTRKQAPQGVERSVEKLQLACEVSVTLFIEPPCSGWPDPTVLQFAGPHRKGAGSPPRA
jgi:hypothetical protein